MKNKKPIATAALAYLLATFPLAIVWHLILFKGVYEEIGYIARDEPIFAFGFLAILIQGFIMSSAYPMFSRGNYSPSGGLRYALAVGLFFWTSHVLAFAAKGDVHRLDLFIPLETAYLAIQFGVFGLILGYSFQKWGHQESIPATPKGM